MDKLREIALAYHANLSDEEKESALKFFNKMDTNGDGGIDFEEYADFIEKNGLPPEIASREIFDALEVDELMPILHYVNSTGVIRCLKCRVILKGTYFSCSQCFFEDSGTYDLCCACYGSRRFQHQKHEDAIFYDNQTLLYSIRNQLQNYSSPSSDPDRENRSAGRAPKTTIFELHLTAEAYYSTVSREIKQAASNFFDEMDKDDDEQISLKEYVSFMKRRGYPKMATAQFFKDLNISGSGELGFMEVMTLYYIIQSGRPFCDGCNKFIDGLFFTCFECFHGQDGITYNVCPKCYNDGNYDMDHNLCVDNYVLLESKRQEALENMKRARDQMMQRSIVVHDRAQMQRRRSPSTYRAMVPFNPQRRQAWLSSVSSFASIASSVTSLITGCTIM